MKKNLLIYSIFVLLFVSINCFAATMRVHNATGKDLDVYLRYGYYPSYIQPPIVKIKLYQVKPNKDKYINSGLNQIFGLSWIQNNKCYGINYEIEMVETEGKVEIAADGKYKSKKEDSNKKWDQKPWKQAKISNTCHVKKK